MSKKAKKIKKNGAIGVLKARENILGNNQKKIVS